MRVSLFQGILIGVFALGAVVGLFVFATYTSTGGDTTAGPVLIWGTLPQEDIEAALRAVVQTDTALKDVTYEEKEASTLAGELAAAIATGAAPDLILASQEELHALAKFITPLSPGALSAKTFTGTFVDGARVFASANGYYGIPLLVDPLILFYNRSILASSGIALPPATWEGLTGLVPRVAVLSPTRQITRGLIALGTYANVRNARSILSTLFFQTGVPLSAYSSTGVLGANLGTSREQGAPPGEAVLSFYTQFADPAKVSYTWNASLPNSQQTFLVGDLALYLGHVSEARYLRSANPNLNFATALVPQPGTATTKNVYGRIYALMIPRGAKNAVGAFRTAALLSNPVPQAIVAGALGLAPANLNVLGSPPADPLAAVAYEEALYTRGWLSPAALNTDAVFSSMITNVISGRLTLESALVSAESALTALLQQ